MKRIMTLALAAALMNGGLVKSAAPLVVTTFNAAENAKFKVYELGKLSTFADVAKIPAPARDGDGVALKFVTESGLPVNFLIRRIQVTKDNVAQFKAIGEAQQKFKAKRLERLAETGRGILTAYYRQLPNQGLQWTELYTDIDAPRKYRFAPTFGARVYPNGLLVLDIRGDDNLLFGLGEKSAVQLLQGNDRIEIGGGKTVLAKDLADLKIK